MHENLFQIRNTSFQPVRSLSIWTLNVEQHNSSFPFACLSGLNLEHTGAGNSMERLHLKIRFVLPLQSRRFFSVHSTRRIYLNVNGIYLFFETLKVQLRAENDWPEQSAYEFKAVNKICKKKACTFEFRFVNNDRHRKPLTTARKRRRFQRCGKSKIICRRHDFEIRTHRGFTFKWIFITSPRHYVWVRGIRIEFWDPLFVLKILGKTRQRETG